jgi:hypothetical protein
MKARANNSQQKSTFQPKPLTPEQETAIELLLQGQTDNPRHGFLYIYAE